MAQISNFLEDALINATLRNTAYTSPSAVYIALYTTDPTDADTGAEVVGGGYARQVVTFSAPSNGATASNAAVEFPQALANWGTIGWVGIRDAASSGNLLYHAPLAAAKTIQTGDIFRIAAGSLTVTLA